MSRKVTCRYLRTRAGEQCTAEAVDPAAEILLCTRHLGRAAEIIKALPAPFRRALLGRVDA